MMLQLVAPVVPRETVEVLQPLVRAIVAAMEPDLAAMVAEQGWEPEQVALGHLVHLLVQAGGTVNIAGREYRLELHAAVQPCPAHPDREHQWEDVGLLEDWDPAYSVCECGARCDHTDVVAVESHTGEQGAQCQDCGRSWTRGR